jgi:hypothetical protein
VKIVVEVVMARVGDGDVRYAIAKAPQPKTGDPLITARSEVATRFPDLWLRNAIIHSTSWRYDEETIVLTFLAYSDEVPLDGLERSLPLDEVEDLADDDNGEASIAAHAIRHLAFLVATEPKEFVPRIREPALARIRRVAPDISRNKTPQAA